jgi:hypothetical protein
MYAGRPDRVLSCPVVVRLIELLTTWWRFQLGGCCPFSLSRREDEAGAVYANSMLNKANTSGRLPKI